MYQSFNFKKGYLYIIQNLWICYKRQFLQSFFKNCPHPEKLQLSRLSHHFFFLSEKEEFFESKRKYQIQNTFIELIELMVHNTNFY